LGPWKEYLRALNQQARLFLRLAYTEADIVELPDSDGDNEIVDEYDEMTWHDTVQPERGSFQNYVVSIFFVLLLCTIFDIEVLNCDYCCTCDTSWMIHK
jgi:hypothetical protein